MSLAYNVNPSEGVLDGHVTKPALDSSHLKLGALNVTYAFLYSLL